MADKTKIEWTDATWNPITGCSVVSPGCTNCYAMRLAGTRLQHHPSRAGLTDASKAGPVWNGQVRLNEQWLDQPVRWKKPRRVFVCAHGDLFHENVPDEWVDKVFRVMALSDQHIFQVLTKRPERMKDYIAAANKRIGSAWPLLNVHLGVSVEDQARADERIPHLLDTPAAVRFISAEPLIGSVDLRLLHHDGMTNIDALTGHHGVTLPLKGRCPHIDWVIVGGESGPGYRPMDLDWARSIRDQCKAAGVPFFMKQTAGKKAIPDDLMIREIP